MDKCIHLWSIEVAQGPTSLGTCTYCREVKIFNNYVGDFTAKPWIRKNDVSKANEQDFDSNTCV